jgi:hypothetical protein
VYDDREYFDAYAHQLFISEVEHDTNDWTRGLGGNQLQAWKLRQTA